MDSWHNNLLSSANKGKINLIQAINISEDVTAYSTNKAVEEFPSHSFKNKNSDKMDEEIVQLQKSSDII